jgi:multiple antibiotic resistance protein
MGIIALFPVVNPIGTAFIVNPYLSDLNKKEKKKAVRQITIYAFSISAVSLFGGHWILELFGITIPVIQLAGGIMICKIGWEFLSSDNGSNNKKQVSGDEKNDPDQYNNVKDKLFYPITFPMTTGAGTISVLFTLSAHSASKNLTSYLINTGAILLAIILMCVLVYVFFLNTKTMIHYLGSNGEKIFNRIISFLIFSVGLQIAISGLTVLIK